MSYEGAASYDYAHKNQLYADFDTNFKAGDSYTLEMSESFPSSWISEVIISTAYMDEFEIDRR